MMPQKHHIHSTMRDAQGQEVCTVCGTIVITPILNSDDPRLHPVEEVIWSPLPEVLVALYYEGPEYGLPRAPVAPYVRDVAAYEGEVARFNPEELWDKLSDLVL